MQSTLSICRPHQATRSPARRRGIALVESVVALVVLMVAMATLAQLLSLWAQQRRGSEQRRLALQELANRAEAIAMMPWNDVTAEKLASWQPADQLLAAIPKAAGRAAVSDEPGDLPARRVRLSVSWTDAVGQEVTPIELTVWRFDESKTPSEKVRP